MKGSKIKTASKTTTKNSIPNNSNRSKIKTSPESKKSPPPSTERGGGSKHEKSGRKSKDKDRDILGRIDTYNTTDTGTQVVELGTPGVKRASKKIVKATIYITKAIPEKIEKRKARAQDLEEIKEDLRVERKVKTSRGKVTYKKVGSIRVENDLQINRLTKTHTPQTSIGTSKIKTEVYKSRDVRTAIDNPRTPEAKRSKEAPSKESERTSKIKTGVHKGENVRSPIKGPRTPETKRSKEAPLKESEGTSKIKTGGYKGKDVRAAINGPRTPKDKDSKEIPLKESKRTSKIKTGGYKGKDVRVAIKGPRTPEAKRSKEAPLKESERTSKIKTGGYKSNEIKTALKKHNASNQKATIKTGTYVIGGYRAKSKLKYRSFKQSNAKVNENDTGNTSYEAIQDGRRKFTKATNVIRTGSNVVTGVRQISRVIEGIGKEKVDIPEDHLPRIKTGRYINPDKKRTIENSPSARQVSTSIHTGQVKADINLDRLQGRGSYSEGKTKFEKFQSFAKTNAVVQERDVSNTGIESFQQARISKTRIKNTARGIKNTVRGVKNTARASKNTYRAIKSAKKSISKVKAGGGKIYTSSKGKVRTGVKNRRYGAKDIKGKTSIVKKSVSVVQNIAAKTNQIVTKAKALANPIVLKGVLIGVLLVVVLGVISATVAMITSNNAVIYTYIVADPETIIEAKNKVDELNQKATERIENLSNSTGYDDIKLDGPDSINVGFQDVLAIMGVKNEQVYKLSEVSGIHKLFYSIETEDETYEEREWKGVCHHDVDGKCTSECHDEYETVEKKRLIITVEQYNFIKVMDDIEFDQEQQNWGMNLAGCNLLDLYPELADAGITLPGGSLTGGEIDDILSKLPTTGATRENIVAIAESLVGKIAYGWGSKADPPAIPSKLDCSGFTDYVFKLAGAGTIGAGTYGQWDNSYPIDQNEIKIGDLGFLKPPSQASDNSPNHVGIFVGYDSNGNMMFVHCQGGTGTVKTTAKAASLHYFRRPFINFAE